MVAKDGKTTDFTKDDGDDLGHEVHNINGIVGETPDKTAGLWKAAGDEGYEKAGYVLIGLSNNAKNDKLGKQELTKGVQDQYVYLMKVATPQIETKQAERTIHYVGVVHDDDDVTKAQVLKDPTTQNVTLTGTYYVDHSGKRVAIKNVEISGQTYHVIDDSKQASETWTASDLSGVTDKSNGNVSFDAVTTPDTIGKWNHFASLDKNNGKVAQGVTDWQKALTDGYLVYKQPTNYNIHYVDVTKSVIDGKTSGFTKNDGNDLGHEVTDINGYVDETPDKTADLWKTYADEGYALVSNPSGDQLGKQELTKDVQDQYVYLMKVATPQTETKTAERTIHYVGVVHDNDDVTKAQVLKDPITQNITLTGTYYTDHSGKRVNTKTVTVNGHEYDVVVEPTDDNPAKEIWKIDGKATGVSEDKGKYDFAKVDTPETIGSGKTQWKHQSNLDKKNGIVSVDPNNKEWKTNKTTKLPDGYVVYKQHAKYNIHYIDVNGVEDKTTYDPTDGQELTDHKVENVGNGKDLTTTPVATGLWSKEDYEKAGYVLVGLSDNAKNDKLGKQTITIGVQDQYVYLKHAVKTITHETPKDDVPKDKDGKPAVDPKDLHKEFNRNIYYKAITADGKTLKAVTKQHAEFNGSIDVDVVTGKTTIAETIKVDGKDVKVATKEPGKITWDKPNATFDAIDQPTITLNTGDKYATSADMVGTWNLISGKAAEIKLTPSSDNPVDETLVYNKQVPTPPAGGGDDHDPGTPGDRNPGGDDNPTPGKPGNPEKPEGEKGKTPEPKKPGDKKDNTKKPEVKKPKTKKTEKSKKPQTKKSKTKTEKSKKSETKKSKTKTTKSKKSQTKAKTHNERALADGRYSKLNAETGAIAPHAQRERALADGTYDPLHSETALADGKYQNNSPKNALGTGQGANGNGEQTNQLPQTGEKENFASIIGAVLASMAGLLGLAVTDKKKKHE